MTAGAKLTFARWPQCS